MTRSRRSSAGLGTAVLAGVLAAFGAGPARGQVQAPVQADPAGKPAAAPVTKPSLAAPRIETGRAEPTQLSAVLDLPDEGFLLGNLLESPKADGGPRGALTWKSPLFATSLEFAIDEILRIRFPKGQPPAVPPGAWRFDIRGNDLVIGTIEAIDADHVTVAVGETAAGAPLKIKRSWIERAAHVGGGAKVIVPGELAGWSAARGAWHEQAGRITCGKPGSAAYRDVDAPSRACFDLVLSWDERPELDVAFGADPEQFGRLRDGAGGKKPAGVEEYRLDLAGDTLQVIREGKTARLETAATVAAGAGSLRVQVFVDQQTGRMALVFPDREESRGKPVFDETIAPLKAAVHPGFAIKLRKGDVRIDRFRVNEWSAAEPRLEAATGIGGPTAVLESYDKSTDEFVVRDGGEPRRVAEKAVQEIEFPGDPQVSKTERAVNSLAAAFNNGCRLTGMLREVAKETVTLNCEALAEPLACPFKQLAMLESVGPRAVRPLPGRIGMLETLGGKTLGCFVNPAGDGPGGPLWQPRGALAGAAIEADMRSVRIDCRGAGALGGVGLVAAKQGPHWVVADVDAGGPAGRDGRIKPGWRIEAIGLTERGTLLETQPLKIEDIRALLRGTIGSAVRLRMVDPGGKEEEISLLRDVSGRGDLAGASEKDVLDKALKVHDIHAARLNPPAGGQATVYLKTGDSILCTVLAGDADGLRVKTDLAEDLKIPTAAMRAVELLSDVSKSLSRLKQERLLTLPRMQMADPPTHMLRLQTADYLRGKLVSLDDKTVRMNVLGTVKDFPRAEISRLIWLSVEGDAAEPEAFAAVMGKGAGLPVQAVMTDGRWLTMMAERVDGDRLIGSSGVLGPVAVDLARCEYLLVGKAIGEANRGSRPYSQWILKPAPPPRTLQKQPPAAGVGPPARPAEEEAGVGKAAPAFSLERLDANPDPKSKREQRLALADLEGRIVVMSLWTAGSQPSVAALPEVMEATAPFADAAVTLLAINDRDGREAAGKAVAALPQRPTVLLDAKGLVRTNLGLSKLETPFHVVVDREGRIAAVIRGADAEALDALRRKVAAVVEHTRAAAGEFEQFAAASAAAMSRDRSCLNTLGRLLDAESMAVRRKTAVLLRQLTGLTFQEMPYKPDDPPANRKPAARQWQQWLASEGITAELAFPSQDAPAQDAVRQLRGRTLICRPNDVVEFDDRGAQTFRVPTAGTWACEALPNGNRLIGEHGAKAVTEYDDNGQPVWSVRNLPGGPMSVRRLENGNTLVSLSDANMVAEYDPNGDVAWTAKIEGRPCDARRLPDGTTLVAAHKANRIVEIDANGTEVWSVENIEDPQTVQRLANGNTLVAMSTPGIVREIDRAGKVVWSKDGFKIAIDAQRLPDGRTLVQELNGPIIELDVDGTELKRDPSLNGGFRFHRW
jgi:hypothetical protein